MAANNSNHVWNREQFAQGRARVLVRAMEDFERMGMERGLGSPPFTENPRKAQ